MKIVIIIILMHSCCCIRVPTKIKLCGWSELIRATQVIIDQMIFSWGSSPRIKPPCFSLWQISPKLSPQQIYGNKYQTIIKIVKTTRNLVLMHLILCLRFRELAMSVLMREPLGSFMVRNSTSQPGTLALSVRYKWLRLVMQLQENIHLLNCVWMHHQCTVPSKVHWKGDVEWVNVTPALCK